MPSFTESFFFFVSTAISCLEWCQRARFFSQMVVVFFFFCGLVAMAKFGILGRIECLRYLIWHDYPIHFWFDTNTQIKKNYSQFEKRAYEWCISIRFDFIRKCYIVFNIDFYMMYENTNCYRFRCYRSITTITMEDFSNEIQRMISVYLSEYEQHLSKCVDNNIIFKYLNRFQSECYECVFQK